MKIFDEDMKVVDLTEDNIIHLWEPYSNWNIDIRAKEKYKFQVKCAHFSSSLNELELVYQITDEKENKSFFSVERYEICSDRYWDLLENLYCGSVNHREIVAVREDDFLYFGGYAHLDIINGFPVINFNSMDTFESPYSVIHPYLYMTNVDE